MNLWVIVPAAGVGRRFGGAMPKQYVELHGRPLIAHTLDVLTAHSQVAGAVVALAADDPFWPGWTSLNGKPILRCAGGRERADSVLAGLTALPASVAEHDWVLVHDAARPCLSLHDLDALIERGRDHPDGAILAAPLRDTLKRADANGFIETTVPRDSLWRALTPQMFRRGQLAAALVDALAQGVGITDEAMAMERRGVRPLLIEGSESNLKVTTAGDLVLAEYLLSRGRTSRGGNV